MTRECADLLDTDPITLGEGSKLLLRGIVSVSAMRAEIKRGNLVVERIGKNLFTTPAAIREMRERCRVKPTQASMADESATKEMASQRAALDAAVAALRRKPRQR